MATAQPSPYLSSARPASQRAKAPRARGKTADGVLIPAGFVTPRARWDGATRPEHEDSGADPARFEDPRKRALRENVLANVGPKEIAGMDFQDLEQWRRAAKLLVRQVYRSKFIFGDLIENIDPSATSDKAGELHVDDIPPSLLREDLDGDGEARLRTAEGVIRKLYARSMDLTAQNAALKEENERLRALQRRPRSAQGGRAPAADPGGAPQQPAPLSERGAAQVAAGEKAGSLGGPPRRDGARSIPPEMMIPGGGVPGAGKSSGLASGAHREALEALAPGSTHHDRVKELEGAVAAGQQREARLRAEIEQAKKLEMMLWDTDQPHASEEVIGQLRARFESAKTMLLSVTNQLQDVKEDNIRLEAAVKARDALTKRRVEAYLSHRNQLIGAFAKMLERLPGVRPRRKPLPANGGLDQLADEQAEVMRLILTNSAAIGEVSSSMLGEREEFSESGSESDEEGGDAGFSTSSLQRACEAVALNLTPDSRQELLEILQQLYHRFHLVKMEVDAVQCSHEDLRKDADRSIRALLMERSALRGALSDLLQRGSFAAGGELGGEGMEHMSALVGEAGASDLALIRAQAEMDAIEELQEEVEEDHDSESDYRRDPGGSASGHTGSGKWVFTADTADADGSSDDASGLSTGAGPAVEEDGGAEPWVGEGGAELAIVQAEDGSLYEGELYHAQASGAGTETYPDGSAYEGQFEAGVRHGLGVYFFASGRVYEGEWGGGVRHGYGIERVQGEADREPSLVCYERGGIQRRVPLSKVGGDEAKVEALQMDVLDAVQAAREQARAARSTATMRRD